MSAELSAQLAAVEARMRQLKYSEQRIQVSAAQLLPNNSSAVSRVQVNATQLLLNTQV